jgi:ankyrin repeat protein
MCTLLHCVGRSSLTCSAAAGTADIVLQLLDAKASTSSSRADVETPLMAAASAGFDGCVRLLIEAGADINTTNSNGHSTPSPLPRDIHACVLIYGMLWWD